MSDLAKVLLNSYFLTTSTGQINILIQDVANVTGPELALATLGSNHVWLGQTIVPKLDEDDLIAAPFVTQGLFRSIFSIS